MHRAMTKRSGAGPLLGLLLLFLAVPALAAEAPMTGYSTEPLRAPLFDEAQVVAEVAAINNWLNAHIQGLTYEQMKGPREHLYYLIDSRIKQHYAAEKRVRPAKHDPLLEVLFSWAERLDVYGGALAFNAVKASTSAAKAPTLKLPQGISLGLEKDLFIVRSRSGWTLSFPYYFMIGRIAGFTAKDGPRTQLVMISTGAAKDKSAAGRSQATLLFLFSPDKSGAFERYWIGQLGIRTEGKPIALGVKGLSSRDTVEAQSMVHKELTSWSDSTGSFAVAYLGVEGTYEWNRQHFIDFLRAIETTAEQQRDDPPRPPR
jgi:hypothetical protein